MNPHTAQPPPESPQPPDQSATAPPPTAAPPEGRARLGPWLQRWAERVAAASQRAQARITGQFRVPPGGG